MSKFRVNDRVRTLSYGGKSEGSVGVITQISSGPVCNQVKMIDPRGDFKWGNTYGFKDIELELVGIPNSMIGKRIHVSRRYTTKSECEGVVADVITDDNGDAQQVRFTNESRWVPIVALPSETRFENAIFWEVIPDPLPTGKYAIISLEDEIFMHSKPGIWITDDEGFTTEDMNKLVNYNKTFRVIFGGEGEW